MTSDYRIVVLNRSSGLERTVFLSDAEVAELRSSVSRNPQRVLTKDEQRISESIKAQLGRAFIQISPENPQRPSDWPEHVIGDIDLGF